jgi:DNA-binding MarR family transcriptional regulator
MATPLNERAGFLISQLGFYAAARFAERLAPLDLHPRHFGLLTHLSRLDGQSQQKLAAKMGVHRNSMVGLIDDLEGRGLVERRRHPADRRAHAVHLTDTARELLAKAQHEADAHDAELLAVLDGQERSRLIGFLRRVAESTPLPSGVHPGLRDHAP